MAIKNNDIELNRELLEEAKGFVQKISDDMKDEGIRQQYINGAFDPLVTVELADYTEKLSLKIIEKFRIIVSQTSRELLDRSIKEKDFYFELYGRLIWVAISLARIKHRDMQVSGDWDFLMGLLDEQFEVLGETNQLDTIRGNIELHLPYFDEKPIFRSRFSALLSTDPKIQGLYLVNPSKSISDLDNGVVLATVSEDVDLSGAEITNLPSGIGIDAVNGTISVANQSALIPGNYLLFVKTIDEKQGETISEIELNLLPDSGSIYVVEQAQLVDAYNDEDILATVNDPLAPIKEAILVRGEMPSGMSLNPVDGTIKVKNATLLFPGSFHLRIDTINELNFTREHLVNITILEDTEATYEEVEAVSIAELSDGDVLTSVTDFDGSINNASITTLPLGVSLDMVTGEIKVTDVSQIVPGRYPLNVTVTNVEGDTFVNPIVLTIQGRISNFYYETEAPLKIQNYTNEQLLASVKNVNSNLSSAELINQVLHPAFSLDSTTGNIEIQDVTRIEAGEFNYEILLTDNTGFISIHEVNIVILPDYKAFYRLEPRKDIKAYVNGDQIASLTDPDGNVVAAELYEGTLPTGLSLDASSGAITVQNASALEIGFYTFKVKSTDEFNGETINRLTIFFFEGGEVVYEINPPRNIDDYVDDQIIGRVINSEEKIVKAEITSGNLPEGVSLNTNTAELYISDSSKLQGGFFSGMGLTTTDERGGQITHDLTLEFIPDREAKYTIFIPKAANLYQTNDSIAQVVDADGVITRARILSGTLPSGVAIHTVNGELYVHDNTRLIGGTYPVTIETRDETGGLSLHNLEIIIGQEIDLAATYIVEVPKNVDAYGVGSVIATPYDPNGSIVGATIISGNLAAGTSLDSTHGVIQVSDPSALIAGTYTALILLTDAIGGTTEASVTYTINPDIEAVYTISPIKRFDLLVDNELLASASDGDGLIVYAQLISGTLPAGVGLNSLNGDVFVTDATLLAASSEEVVIQTTDITGGKSTLTITIAIGADSAAVYTVEKARTIHAIRNDDLMAYVVDPDGEIVNTVINSGVLPSGLTLHPNGDIVVTDREALIGVSRTLNLTTTDDQGGTTGHTITIVIKDPKPIVKERISPGICERLGDIKEHRPIILLPEKVVEKTLFDFSKIIFERVCSDLSGPIEQSPALEYFNGANDGKIKNDFLSIMTPTYQNILGKEADRTASSDQAEIDDLTEDILFLTDLYNEQMYAAINLIAFRQNDVPNNTNSQLNIFFTEIEGQMEDIKTIPEMSFVLGNLTTLSDEFTAPNGKGILHNKIMDLL